MARPKISREFRSRLSEKLMDLGNFIVVTLAIGQFVSGKEFLMSAFTAGIISAILCYIISYFVAR